jgi:Mrp family chromosome partitioning ATPase
MSRMLDALKRLESHLGSSADAAPPTAVPPTSAPPALAPPPPMSAAVPPAGALINTEQDIVARLAQAEQLTCEATHFGADSQLERGSGETAPVGNVSAERRDVTAPCPATISSHPAIVAPHYAHLRERILTQIPRDRSAALLFVHPGGVEDVPTTVAELAVAMTEATPGDILAIDANIGPRHAAGGAGGGLIDVLANKSEWYTAVLPTRNARVVLLPSGTWPTGAEAPDERRVRQLMDQFRARFDLVLIDGGSIEDRMATLLSRSCDACYVVLALAHTPQRAVHSALKQLRQAGGRVGGCILTGATRAEAESARS